MVAFPAASGENIVLWAHSASPCRRFPPQLRLRPVLSASGGCGLPGRGCCVPTLKENWHSENSVQGKANPFLEELQQ